ncbi:DUF1015 domain-containing protein [Pedobacter faecalis]|uniref:DUF1015 domain-containing protein n=1 Tax=Pedobacter faecalis TaxID=3041495 RepID=UPI00254A1B69|nr:DUF1015 domain-containing protein [Pedobacter sp. ELA7]
MPRIKPFCALIPATDLQERVVTHPLENYSADEARMITSENRYSFLHLIDPELDNPYLRGTRQELIYKTIGENVEKFLENHVLVPDISPAIYVYRVTHDGLSQTGIWTLTHINDYADGVIRKHESTVERREQALADYLQHTGLDANPVLVTYPPDAAIEKVVGAYIGLASDLKLSMSDSTLHEVWAVRDAEDIKTIETAFENMSCVYIADGHHRAASMVKMGLQKRALNVKRHTGAEPYNYFTTAYMNTDEVRVLEFNRLVRDLGNLSPSQFLTAVQAPFFVEGADRAVRPESRHEIGMYLNEQWYKLRPKPGIFDADDPVDSLDVTILQKNILDPILGICDPRTDPRITFEGGRVPVHVLQQRVDQGIFSVAFTLHPPSVHQVMAVADADGIMPPKSTWVEPKFPVGLLTNYFN